MKPRMAFAVGLLLLIATMAAAGNLELKRFMVFNGDAATGVAATDTTEHPSIWIPVQGATRILLRSWSAKAAFHVSTDADSLFTDTITVFRVAFTDSVSNVNPLVGADSVVMTASAVDTSNAMVRVDFPPLNQQLRGPGNGSGILSVVSPATPGAATADNNGIIGKRYARFYYTPLTRSTAATGLATVPSRTRGLKNFRMEAIVVYGNR